MTPEIHTENGVVVGNVTKKKGVANPIARYLVRQFDQCVSRLLAKVAPASILEVGCGEGEVVKLALEHTSATIVGTDISDKVLDDARANVTDARVRFEKLSIYDIPVTDAYRADMVVCCEVMEHLDDPQAGLAKLHALTTSHCLLSVPREPLWRIMNMARGSYLGDLGNTPGHIQHWSKSGFVAFASTLFDVVEVHAPIPWTVLLCRKR